jgi:hypothetical protein
MARIGADTVRFDGAILIVDSAVDMPDWDFRTYRRCLVTFGELRYSVAEKQALSEGGYRYVLEPWRAEWTDLPGPSIVYGEDYVARRDAGLRNERRQDRAAAVLFWIAPLLGFLPSRFKSTLNDRYAFHPVTLTLQSLFLERILLYGVGALIVIGGVTGILGIWLVAAMLGGAAVGLDLILRTGPAELGSMEQPGFWEWALPGWRRRARR